MELGFLAVIDPGMTAVVVGVALAAYAVIQVALAFGLRRGTVAWGGRYPRRLPTEFRVKSAVSGLVLFFASWFMASAIGDVAVGTIPARWIKSGAWVVTSLLGVGALLSVFSDSRWERFLFGPILLFAAVFTGVWAFL